MRLVKHWEVQRTFITGILSLWLAASLKLCFIRLTLPYRSNKQFFFPPRVHRGVLSDQRDQSRECHELHLPPPLLSSPILPHPTVHERRCTKREQIIILRNISSINVTFIGRDSGSGRWIHMSVREREAILNVRLLWSAGDQNKHRRRVTPCSLQMKSRLSG